MDIDPTITRRAALIAAAGGVGALALAACSSSSSPSSSSSSSPTGSSSGTTLTALDDVPVGSAVSVRLPDGSPGIVARPTSTTAACFSAICTHMQRTVAPDGTQLVCPAHGSIFNAFTGAVENGPATEPLSRVAVRVVNGNVVTASSTTG